MPFADKDDLLIPHPSDPPRYMRPVLPEGRDARIALARATIERCLCEFSQFDPEHQSDFRDPSVVVFHLLVPSFHIGLVISNDVAIALCGRDGAGFPRVEMTSPIPCLQGDECRLWFRVPVGTAQAVRS
jgi:hypothetical protein